jgi:anti-sigma factor RsiW
MNCEEATKLMDGYLDGELDPTTSQSIEQHLRDYPNCDHAFKTHGSLINSCFQQRNSLRQSARRVTGANSILVARRGRRPADAQCHARCSAAAPKKAAQSRAPFFWEHHGVA